MPRSRLRFASSRPTAAIAFLVRRIGPYHHARLGAIAARGPARLTAIEFRPADAAYAWDAVPETAGYRRVRTRSREELCRVLDELRPEAVVCVGYSDPEIHQAAAWALSRKRRLVTCSDSTHDDEPRSWMKEAFKRRVIAAFDAALVAGSRAGLYIGMLGLDGDRRFQPWDVVDNAHFHHGADVARRDEAATRARLKLPSSYFLCVARFVPKKNLARLIEAYRHYAEPVGNDAWSLVLSGAGPMEAELRHQVALAGLASRVHFVGFLQYPDLPACYGLAEALVLPSASDQWGLVVNEAMAAGLPVLVSDRCGCAPDLVRQDENGFTFDPGDTGNLAGLLTRMAGMKPDCRAAMGGRSREIVAAFSPEAFADGLEAAVERALDEKRRAAPRLTRLLVGLLALRSA
jgi:glycosyltransferase involved in cell wall biosynthesis